MKPDISLGYVRVAGGIFENTDPPVTTLDTIPRMLQPDKLGVAHETLIGRVLKINNMNILTHHTSMLSLTIVIECCKFKYHVIKT